MLAAERFPVLTSSDCSICMTTFQAVTRRVPAVHVLWLDAHGDFNTPETTPSRFLGGMCLAAACGRWDAGFEPSLDPSRVLMCGVRDLDAGERVEVETAGVGNARPSGVVPALRGRRVYVHLDLDVLDPDVLPAQFAVPHGLSDTGLRTLLAEVARECDVVGLEVTAFEAPEDGAERARRTELVASIVRALL
jgi:arginase family enzyme